jgi:hypothetical protein
MSEIILSVKHTLTRDEALTFVRKARGKTLFISVGQRAPVAGKDGREYPVSGNVCVSRKIALKFIDDTYSVTMAGKGALCCIRTLSDCVFIGTAA